MLNRKGHIATWLILLGALVLMITAWYTFLSSNERVESKAQSVYSSVASVNAERAYVSTLFVSLVNQSTRLASQTDFERSFRQMFIERARQVELFEQTSTNFFQLINEGNFTIIFNDGVYLIRVKGVTIESSGVGNDRIKQTFDLEITFSVNGVSS